MKARMWIAKIDRYIEPVEIDDNCSLYEEDMDKEVTCPWCGKKVPYGETYTSHVFRTSLGMGYAVCKKCYPHDMWFYRMNKMIDIEREKADIDKLNEAIRLIRDYCIDTECPGCLLKRKGECSLLCHLPCGWAPVTGKD